MIDKPTSTNNINTNECRYKYQLLYSDEYGCYAEREKVVIIDNSNEQSKNSEV